MTIFVVIFLLVSCVVLIPIAVLFVQIVAAVIALKKLQHTQAVASSIRPSVAVIVPAHNEALGLGNTLRSILPQLQTQDRLVLVADNCTDDTAAVAREYNVIVLERFHQTQRGKGFALDYGMQYLKDAPPDVVMIIDADCEISQHLIEELAVQCVARQRPIQANYQMRFPTPGGVKQQVMEFAWLVKNTVRPMGYQWFGLPCQLMGTGMAFTWADLSNADLANGHLVEDMKLGLDLASVGRAPYFCDRVSVKSYFPTTAQGIATQRLRWEHGHLGLIAQEFPRYLPKAIQQKNGLLFAQLMDLAVPPLALLLTLTLGLWLIALLLASLSAIALPLLVMTIALCLLGFGILIAWYWFARSIISLNTLLLAPCVLLMKVPLYLKFIVRRQVDWVRSKRDHD
jgi:glycosyltransferase involved in cell wall biosynthesis